MVMCRYRGYRAAAAFSGTNVERRTEESCGVFGAS